MNPDTYRSTMIIHNERLQAAAAARGLKYESLPFSDLAARALAGAGSALVAFGQKLQGQRPAAAPVLSPAKK